MNAILTINSMAYVLLSLSDAVAVAEVLKNATHLERRYSNNKYELNEKPVVIEIELATETEVSQWLS